MLLSSSKFRSIGVLMNSDEYESLLKKAKSEVPKTAESSERFEVPKADVFTARQTSIKNFSDICKTLRREPKHLAKFLFKELAVPGSMKNNELVLQGKIYKNVVDQRIEEYTKEFVLCKECGKPDTSMQRSDRITTIKCEACGARKPARNI
jgi:translation initiation factor 2 subunit 2